MARKRTPSSALFGAAVVVYAHTYASMARSLVIANAFSWCASATVVATCAHPLTHRHTHSHTPVQGSPTTVRATALAHHCAAISTNRSRAHYSRRSSGGYSKCDYARLSSHVQSSCQLRPHQSLSHTSVIHVTNRLVDSSVSQSPKRTGGARLRVVRVVFAS